MAPRLNFCAASWLGRALRAAAWLSLALCACHDDVKDLSREAGSVTERDAAENVADDRRLDAASSSPSAAEAGSGEAGAEPADVRDGGVAHDAGALDGAVDAADAAAQPYDSQVPDATAGASDAATSTTRDALVARPSIYDDNAKWMCRPGLPGSPCAQAFEVTDLHADGGASISALPSTPADVRADCLYLYPTIDPGLLAEPRNLDFPDIDRTAARDVVLAQAVPFRGTCALYAPLYRQGSLNSLEDEAARESRLETGYRDLEAAFDYYLEHTAPDRPIVLIAHSQGSILMTRLLARRFEGHPDLLARLVVAVLAGAMGGFVVPQAGIVGGSLKQIPLCTSAAQTGCVLTYNTFGTRTAPNMDYAQMVGRVANGLDPGCSAPPGGSGGSALRLAGALFPVPFASGLVGLVAPVFDFGALRVRTRYARYANFFSARCANSAAGLSYLLVEAAPLPGDVRKDPVPYDNLTLSDGALGLHALDYSFVSADLIQAVETKLSAHLH